MKLSLTYSAYREMEQIPGAPLQDIGEAILNLADEPHPAGADVLEGLGGCLYLSIDGSRDCCLRRHDLRSPSPSCPLGTLFQRNHSATRGLCDLGLCVQIALPWYY